MNDVLIENFKHLPKKEPRKPRKPSQPGTARDRLLHMYINPELKKNLRKIAELENRTLSNLIETVLTEYSDWYQRID